MRSEWKEARLGDIAVVKGGKRLPKGKKLLPSKTDHPYIRVGDLNDKRVLHLTNAVEYIDDETYQAISQYAVDADDLIISIAGTIGLVAIIGSSLDKACLTENCARLVKLHQITAQYLYYYLVSGIGQGEMKKGVVGAAQAKLPLGALRDIRILLPPLHEQHAIAATLSCLDDKIALNDKITANLEEQVRAIFKSWFVEFRPFRGGGFVHSKLGLIPEGWRVGTFRELISSTTSGGWGKDIPTGSHTKEVYCIRGADIPPIAQGYRGKMPVRYILPDHHEKKALAPGNLVVEISGGSPTQSTGRIVEITAPFLAKCNKRVICSNFCRAVAVQKQCARFVYRYWDYLYGMGLMFNYENGTTGIKNFDFSGFVENYPIPLPPGAVIEKFYETTRSFTGKLYANGTQSETLAALRDTLLPKLLSGEIAVPAAEAMLQERS